jgi:hypothetical protein
MLAPAGRRGVNRLRSPGRGAEPPCGPAPPDERMLILVRTSLIVLFAAMTIALVVMALRLRDEEGPLDAEAVALQWVAEGVAQDARRDGDRWEVDVVRDDGSMVQVNLGDDLELRGLDEELGPAGTLARDELKGRARVRAVQAAFVETGPGYVVSVERDSPRRIKVRVRTGNGRQLGVVLDGKLRIVEVDSEDPRDE